MAAAQVNQMAARRAGNPCLCQMPIERQCPTQDGRLGVGLSSYWCRATMHAIHRDTSAAARWPISEATTYRALSSHRHGTRSTSHATNTECQGVVVTGACCAMHEAAAGSRIHWSQKQNGLHQNYQACNPCALPPPRGEPHRRLDLVPRCRPRQPQLSSAGTDALPPNFSAIASCASLSHHVGWPQPAKRSLEDVRRVYDMHACQC
jgi:hypothetical protein